jgi:hypothetical protein
MINIPRGWTFTLGLSVLAVIAATIASTVGSPDEDGYSAEGDPCFRYGRFECCLRPDE